MIEVAEIRKEYKLRELLESDVAAQPLIQLNTWVEEAVRTCVNEPTAMNLATVSAGGRPSARIVLLKALEKEGLVFYTNYASRKGIDIKKNPFAAITFFWPELERQVRIEGRISKVAPEVSDKYFHSRPLESQLGSIASPQSQVIEGRAALEMLNLSTISLYKDKPVTRPGQWGGYLLTPDYFEFWQGRPSRLHDRIAYFSSGKNAWEIRRLAP